MFEHILVTLDGSEFAERALRYAGDLAQLSKARVSLLSVVPPVGPTDEARGQRCRAYLEQHAEALKAAGVTQVATNVQFGEPVDLISEVARAEAADLIVMTTRGLGAYERDALGSVALSVLTTAHCPIFMVRIDDPAPPRTTAEERWQYEGGGNVG